MRSACRPQQDGIFFERIYDRALDLAITAAVKRVANPETPPVVANPLTTNHRPVILYGDYNRIYPEENSLLLASTIKSDFGESPDHLFYVLHIEYVAEDSSPFHQSGDTVPMAVQAAILLYNFAIAHLIKASYESDSRSLQLWNQTSMRLLELAYIILKSNGYDDVRQLDDSNLFRFACVFRWIVEAILRLSMDVSVPMQQRTELTTEVQLIRKFLDILQDGVLAGTETAGAA